MLAGRQSTAGNLTVTGNVSVGNRVINPVAFRKNVAYVMQEDALFATATPREALLFSASMRLPSSVSSDVIVELVEALLDDLVRSY